MKAKVVLSIVAILTIIQFIPSNIQTNIMSNDSYFIKSTRVPDDVLLILQKSCYDCHSNKSNLPWYASIAPTSWLVKHDIEEGREHLNFSEWENYSNKKALHKVEECIEMVEEEEMPMPIYSFMHPSTRLTDYSKNKLLSWFSSLKTLK